MLSPGRTPPVAVRRELAAEVGFGCPVEGCGSPYLTWHHFDPPWAEGHTHNSEGMIALCRDHHPEADRGAFTVDQLRELKRVGRDRNQLLGARFNWMREELVTVVGGNFYVETPIAIRIKSDPIAWFDRDDDNRLLVNLDMPTTSGQPRMAMRDNFWLTEGADEREIVCPPSGYLVEAKYPNEDRLRVEFSEIESVEAFDQKYPKPDPYATLSPEHRARLESMGAGLSPDSHRPVLERIGIQFPVATVEVAMKVGGTDLDFGPSETAVGGVVVRGNWMQGGRVGIQIGEAPDES